jgi:hypothetical protein
MSATLSSLGVGRRHRPRRHTPSELNADGTLKNPGKLIQYGGVNSKAKFKIPVEDSAFACHYGICPKWQWNSLRDNVVRMETDPSAQAILTAMNRAYSMLFQLHQLDDNSQLLQPNPGHRVAGRLRLRPASV